MNNEQLLSINIQMLSTFHVLYVLRFSEWIQFFVILFFTFFAFAMPVCRAEELCFVLLT